MSLPASYKAPLRELRFVLNDLLGIDEELKALRPADVPHHPARAKGDPTRGVRPAP
uniref:acyl-CoA dehydrogenase N-terminal domain-containing protein n=1 Tax=Variovorax boronicumulans TaxID=436515 RepID=UPI0035A23984